MFSAMKYAIRTQKQDARKRKRIGHWMVKVSYEHAEAKVFDTETNEFVLNGSISCISISLPLPLIVYEQSNYKTWRMDCTIDHDIVNCSPKCLFKTNIAFLEYNRKIYTRVFSCFEFKTNTILCRCV